MAKIGCDTPILSAHYKLGSKSNVIFKVLMLIIICDQNRMKLIKQNITLCSIKRLPKGSTESKNVNSAINDICNQGCKMK